MEKIEEIFTIFLDENKLEFEGKEFLSAILKKYKELLHQHSINTTGDLLYHPSMAWSIYREPENVDILKESLEISQIDNDLFNFNEDSNWVNRPLELLSQTNSSDLNQEICLKMKVPTETEIELIKRALNIIEIAWPEAYKQIMLLSKKIVMISSNGDNFTSATAAYAFGALFLKGKPGWNAINFVDLLIHESGHQALMVKQTFGRMIENLSEKADSPLRKDQRWLNGTLHASYVLWRVLKVFSKIKEEKFPLSKEEYLTMENLEKEFVVNLENGIRILEDKAIFTPLGQLFFDEIKQELESSFFILK